MIKLINKILSKWGYELVKSKTKNKPTKPSTPPLTKELPTEEITRPIPGASNFAFSNFGYVLNIKTGRKQIFFANSAGIRTLSYCRDNGKTTTRSIRSLWRELFPDLPLPSKYLLVMPEDQPKKELKKKLKSRKEKK